MAHVLLLFISNICKEAYSLYTRKFCFCAMKEPIFHFSPFSLCLRVVCAFECYSFAPFLLSASSSNISMEFLASANQLIENKNTKQTNVILIIVKFNQCNRLERRTNLVRMMDKQRQRWTKVSNMLQSYCV